MGFLEMTADDKIERVTTSIKRSDLKFIHQRGLKVASVLRTAVNELRSFEEGEVNWKFANERLQKKIEKIMGVLEHHFDEKTFKSVLEKI